MTKQRDIDLHDDEHFEGTDHRMRHIGWGVLALCVMVALAGFTGSGPLNRTSATSGSLRAEYGRVGRATDSSTIRIASRSSSPLHIWISTGYLDHFRIDSIVPHPFASDRSSDRVRFSFSSDPATEAQVVFHLTAEEGTIGPVTGQIGVETGETLEVRQWFLP